MKPRIKLAESAVVMLLFGGVNEVNADPLTYKVEGETVSVVECDKNASGALVIPSSYEGKPVTRIGDAAFIFCNSLTVITIPNSVKEIGRAALVIVMTVRLLQNMKAASPILVTGFPS
jgi:hypothetical protein